MALNENIKVKMPEHCVKVPKNGTTYIQYTLRAYRNAKGKPTSDRIAIGKLDEATGMLIPNRNYYEIFEKKAPDALPELVRSNGVYRLFSQVCKKIGIERLLKQLFPERWKQILWEGLRDHRIGLSDEAPSVLRPAKGSYGERTAIF